MGSSRDVIANFCFLEITEKTERRNKISMETVDEQNTESTAVAPAPPPRKSLWKLGGLSWKELARRVWLEIYKGILLTHAAALSFYFLIALFPLVLFLLTILGFFTGSVTELRALLLTNLSRVAPYSASTLIQT